MTTEYFGKGDPARSLALLWRTSERASRKGKPDLSVDRIVRAAIEVADAEGLQALSMRRVAERLGVGTMSLYTYVPGKPELFDVMLDTVYGETDRSDDVPGGWRGRLEHVARENWALYLRHPWLSQVAASRPVLGPHGTAKYDYELRAVDGIGLTDVEMDAVVTLVAGFVHGTARGAVEASQAERETGMTDEQWWAAHAPFLSRIADVSRFPTATRVGEAAGEAMGTAYSAERAFEFGLQRLLDGIEALITRRTTT
ncbi:TetR/AcrR family transcriptional regulator [Nonomuraea roseoviolacea subsp. roseoviolacea]|uniref:AcrR family transcriptional regulator n=1 Tax=Nonomuraea roseoviolacea subsp. carminata TaxID=160689 RepID=A0ABT1JV99_9ACTN|nr:TetR/AcrR family transcriptional regulator [Nonomuraea roseoviolacea]MCP2345277.1 AcrR family transcriptional regulator [Nonomuraea roseoviolacea subsp. carminata]